MPPKVQAAAARRRQPALAPTLVADRGGARREYWIQAEPVKWNIVPTRARRDDGQEGQGQDEVHRLRLPAPTRPASRRRSGPATIPGPLIEAETGDAIVVNFRNKLDAPVTIHPHGVFYSQEMDGAYKGRHTDPGGFVQQQADLPVRLGGARGHRGRVALPRPRADGPAARLQGPVRAADRSAGRARRGRTREFNVALPLLQPVGDRASTATSPASTAAPTPATRRP